MIWTFKILLLKYWIEVIHIFISTTVKTTLIRRHREEKQTRLKDIIRRYPTRNKSKPGQAFKALNSWSQIRSGRGNLALPTDWLLVVPAGQPEKQSKLFSTGEWRHAPAVMGQDRQYCFIEMKLQKNWKTTTTTFVIEDQSVGMPEDNLVLQFCV